MCLERTQINTEVFMKSYAFHIQKGGVGKTTLSSNIAHMLSSHGKTLLVDCDPQGNASSYFLTSAPDYELADALQGKCSVKESIVNVSEDFYMIPTFGVDGGLKAYGENKLNDEPFIFQDLSEEIKKESFDYVIYDLSPGMSRLEKCVLLAVDEVITPLFPEFFSLDGIEIFTSELEKVKKAFRVRIKHSKVVINNMNESLSLHKDVRDSIQNISDFDHFTIPQDTNFKKAQRENKPLLDYNPKSRAIEDLEKLAVALK